MKSLQLAGTLKTETGKSASNQIRKNGEVPCNLYGGENSLTFSAPYNKFNALVYNHEFFTVDVTVDGKTYKTIIKEIQFHPVSDKILHIDFLELVEGKSVIAEIPVTLTGLAAGVKNGGKLVQKLRTIRVKATPENLVDNIEVDVTKLKLGRSIKVREVIANNFEVLNPGAIPVASVEIPRALRGAGAAGGDDEDEETAEAAPAEGGEAAAE